MLNAERERRLARQKALGIVPQEINMDPFFTPREALEKLYMLTKLAKS